MPLKPLDYEEIRRLVAKYDWAVDMGDPELYASTFAQQGVFWIDGWGDDSSLGGRYEGREQLFKCGKAIFEQCQGYLRHWNNGVLWIEGDGDVATMRSYMIGIAIGTMPDAHIMETGCYYDSLRRIDGKWLFELRHFVADPQFAHRSLSWDAQKFTDDLRGNR